MGADWYQEGATLYGLSLDQLEAVRGYCETVAAVGAMHRDARAPFGGLAEHDFRQRALQASIGRLDAVAAAGPGPHADGTRYALTLPAVAAQLGEVRACVARMEGPGGPAREAGR